MVRLILLFNMLLLISGPALAQPSLPPLNVTLEYDFRFAGLKFGDAVLNVSERPDETSISSRVRSSGIARIFVKHKSTVIVTRYKDAVTYVADYKTRNKRRQVTLEYAGGKYVRELLDPPEDYSKRPRVSQELKDQSIDLLSGALKLRELAWRAKEAHAEQFAFTVFDGRRLTKIHARVMPPKEGAFRIAITRELVAGYTASELEDAKDEPPPAEITFSADPRFIPTRLEVPLALGTAVAELRE